MEIIVKTKDAIYSSLRYFITFYTAENHLYKDVGMVLIRDMDDNEVIAYLDEDNILEIDIMGF